MPDSLRSRVKRSWNAFLNRDPTDDYAPAVEEVTYGYRPDRTRFTRANQNTIITPIYNRIAIDVASISINHVRLDKDGRYNETLSTGLNECLTLSANIDQTGRALVQDIVMSMLDEGCVAVVPVDTNKSIYSGGFDVESLRVGKIIDWRPSSIRVHLYNDRRGIYQDIWLPKKSVAIIENPFYSVMNERNSTLSRLKRKLALIDIVDEKNSSAKLDLIIQLPYVVKSKLQEDQAEKRRKRVESQLENSKYGIAYADGSERITQLNRPIESNLLKHVEYLTTMLYGQLGISEAIMNGTADEKEMLNYNNRTIEPIISAIVLEFTRKFLTKTARSQGQSVMFFKDPFKLVPVENVAEIADKFTRNEIMTSNEFRQVIGMKPSDDPKADQLNNSNIRDPEPSQQEIPIDDQGYESDYQEVENQNG